MDLNINDMQGGGRKGSDTADHILAIKEAIRKGNVLPNLTETWQKRWGAKLFEQMKAKVFFLNMGVTDSKPKPSTLNSSHIWKYGDI